jgi:phosphoribosylformylglycinamidine synthase
MRVAVIQFPGSNCDLDTLHVLRNVLGVEADLIWHKRFRDPSYDAAILPGGFSYGDHLRAGIIAAHSPAMASVKEMAGQNKPILGICNGFQILVESSLLPGALLRNSSLKFICEWTTLRVETRRSAFTQLYQDGENIRLPIAHNEGRFYVDEETLEDLRRNEQIVFRYLGHNPNGAIDDIAGICNKDRNVVGLMPHPERASEAILGSEDGRKVFESMLNWRR